MASIKQNCIGLGVTMVLISPLCLLMMYAMRIYNIHDLIFTESYDSIFTESYDLHTYILYSSIAILIYISLFYVYYNTMEFIMEKYFGYPRNQEQKIKKVN